MIKGKTPEEIRKLFNIVNDFTPEEEVSFHFHSLLSRSDYACSSPGSNQEREREYYVPVNAVPI